MTLTKELVGAIEHYIGEHIQEWMNQFGGRTSEREIEIRERIVRVEESLERQSALMRQGFEQIDKRFEQVDRRFEELREDIGKRFEQVDRRHGRIYAFLTALLVVTAGGLISLMAQAILG